MKTQDFAKQGLPHAPPAHGHAPLASFAPLYAPHAHDSGKKSSYLVFSGRNGG